ncbi:MAG: GNAT family N-acetyltransferase [Angelakisella sp.]
MEKLTENSRSEVLAYLTAEPEYNIFIIGDIYNFGFEDPIMDTYVQRDSDGGFVCVLLRYLTNYVFYSHKPGAVDAAAVAEQINAGGTEISCISGKKEAVEILIPFFPHQKVKNSYLAALRKNPQPQQVDTEPTKLKPSQAREIVDLYLQVEEFSEGYIGHEDEETNNMQLGLTKGGRCYGIHKDGQLIAAASTSAENNISAMITGVCTHPDYRGKGYASALVAKLCYDCLNEGLSSLCLFYDNPAAGRIYRRIGFVEIGQYMMLKRHE